MTSAYSVNEARHPKPVLWDNPEGQSEEGDGRGVQEVADSCWSMANTILIL